LEKGGPDVLKSSTAIASALVLLFTGSEAYAEKSGARASGGQRMQTQAVADVPHCARKLGTLSIVDGDDPRGWTQYSLAPPQ